MKDKQYAGVATVEGILDSAQLSERVETFSIHSSAKELENWRIEGLDPTIMPYPSKQDLDSFWGPLPTDGGPLPHKKAGFFFSQGLE